MSKDEAARLGGGVVVGYLPPRAATTVPLDPFIENHNDWVLFNVWELRGTFIQKPWHGWWIIYINSSQGRQGFVGDIYPIEVNLDSSPSTLNKNLMFVDAVTGEVIKYTNTVTLS
ncbi:Uncharacterised protein [uncultured archaeon]|nr:Uncharacterised protein [uncultured archaeon]